MFRRLPFFLCIFGVAFLVQATLLIVLDDTKDENMWIRGAETFAQGALIDPSDAAYGYPATTLLFSTSALIHVGIPSLTALHLSIAFLLSIAIAGVVLIARILRPRSMWWMSVAGLLIFHHLWFSATPPSMVVAPFCILVALLALYIEEHREHEPTVPLLFLGLVSGLALATRLDISVLVCTSVFVFLLPLIGRRVWIPILVTAATFVLLDPYLWVEPLEHAAAIYEKITTHYTHQAGNAALSTFFSVSLLSFISFFFAGVLAITKPELLGLSRRYFLWLAATTVLIGGVLFASSYHPLWYFFPFFLLWETLFPLFLFTTVESRNMRYLPLAITVVLTLFQLYILFQLVFLSA